MATGVHDPLVFRFVRHLVGFRDRQSVNVSPQGNHFLAAVAAVQEPDYSVICYAMFVRDAHAAKLLGDVAACLFFFVGKFWVLVQMPTDRHRISVEIFGELLYFIFNHGTFDFGRFVKLRFFGHFYGLGNECWEIRPDGSAFLKSPFLL